MKKKQAISVNDLLLGCIFLLLFGILLFAVKCIDVRPIGPYGSLVGLATVNSAANAFFGTHLLWYHITFFLGALSILVAAGFALLGGMQMVRRRSLLKVDRDILILGVFYLIAIATYFFFEKVVINYRPIILEIELEPSFPSSHAMVIMVVLGLAMEQFSRKVPSPKTRRILCIACAAIIVVTIVGRLISGVHWLTDIAAGTLYGAALIFFYRGVCPR